MGQLEELLSRRHFGRTVDRSIGRAVVKTPFWADCRWVNWKSCCQDAILGGLSMGQL